MAEIPATRASLLLRLRDPNDNDAWGQFVEIYGPLIYHYARKQGLQDADAVDLSQDVLAAVFRSAGRLEYDPKRGAFRSWLFTIVRRKLSNWRRAQKKGPGGGGGSGAQRILEEQYEPQPAQADWDSEWDERLYAWACAQVRCQVAEATWQAFWRTAVDGRPGKQVALELGMNVAAVYNARSRVTACLKELVQSANAPGSSPPSPALEG
jgi:RNA polymerase sigma factor (sigma-70 family)